MGFLFMIFFSTTFSPGSGVEGVKALRYLFARFYFWCHVPGYKEVMEGCPADDTLVWYTILTGPRPHPLPHLPGRPRHRRPHAQAAEGQQGARRDLDEARVQGRPERAVQESEGRSGDAAVE